MNSLTFLDDYKNKRIIVAALNWGLGHAARCIPLIRVLKKENEVILASDGLALELLKKEFPRAPFVELPSYNIHYRGKSFMRNMFFQAPKITGAVSQEMALADELVRKYNISMIVSDHRLGFRSDDCPSVILAHQIQIQSSFGPLGIVGSKLNKYFINQFDKCWIPDYENETMTLAGDLSRPRGLKRFSFIGPVSRFSYGQSDCDIDVLVLLSGPEPARTRLEEKVLKLLSHQDFKVVVVRGSQNKSATGSSEIEYIDLACTDVLENLLHRSTVVIARSGYSTIMDLVATRKTGILIPTPGQTEQEYLARHLSNHEGFHFLDEEELNSGSMKLIAQLLN